MFSVELGSEEESGKDWSDLEREAAEEDKNYNKEDYPQSTGASHKSKKTDRDRDRDRPRDKHKSSKSSHR